MTNHEQQSERASMWISKEALRKDGIKVHEIVRGPFLSPKLLRMSSYDSILLNNLKSEKIVDLNDGIPQPWENFPRCIEFHVTNIIRKKFGLTMGQGIPDPTRNHRIIDCYDLSNIVLPIVSEDKKPPKEFIQGEEKNRAKLMKSQEIQACEPRINVGTVPQISDPDSSHTADKSLQNLPKKTSKVSCLKKLKGLSNDHRESIKINNNVSPRVERNNDKNNISTKFHRNEQMQVNMRMCLDSQKKNSSRDNDDIDVEKLSRIRFKLQNPKNQGINSENVIGPQLIHDSKDRLRHVKEDKLDHNCIYQESKNTGTDDIDYHLHERSSGATTPSTCERKRSKTKMMMHRCKNCEMFTKFSRAFQYDRNKVVEYGTTTNETCTVDCIQSRLNYCICDSFENRDETNLLQSEDSMKSLKRKCHCIVKGIIDTGKCIMNDNMEKKFVDIGEGTENQSIEQLDKLVQTTQQLILDARERRRHSDSEDNSATLLFSKQQSDDENVDNTNGEIFSDLNELGMNKKIQTKTNQTGIAKTNLFTRNRRNDAIPRKKDYNKTPRTSKNAKNLKKRGKIED